VIHHAASACEGCAGELRLAEAYAAEEDGQELEVIVLLCPGCGERTELLEPAVA
jgi:hypothetical protein